MKHFRLFAQLLTAVLLLILFSGCSGLINFTQKDTVDKETGEITVKGLDKDVRILRDDLGIPVIEAKNEHDLAFAAGYVMASDRLAQMVSFAMLGQGRLSEMVGEIGLDLDLYIRTVGIPEAAEKEFESLSPDIVDKLEAFSEGVNAYVEGHQGRLPLDFTLTGYVPEPWRPINSLYIAHAMNLGLSFNLREEVSYLNIARKIGFKKAAWLVPIYPDEPLSMDKAAVLSTIDMTAMKPDLGRLAAVQQKIERMLMPLGIGASNDWGIMPSRTRYGASIIANDTHLPLMQPSLWMLIHMRCPGFDVGGVAFAGAPGIAAGYNGHIAWGMTMVMGDNQDLFIEKLKKVNGQMCYLYEGKWYPVREKREVFKILGAEPVEKTILYTRHGPLMNSALKARPKDISLPQMIDFPYGLALKTSVTEPSGLVESMFHLVSARTMEDASAAIKGVRSYALNFVYANHDHVAWQVSGRYPERKSGRGHLPSPGWTGEYDWQGFVPVDQHPHVLDPASGYVFTANNRTVPPGEKPILGSSWCSPERAERIGTLLKAMVPHTWLTSVAMQDDQCDPFVMKLKEVLFNSPLTDDIHRAIAALPEAKQRAAAREALDTFLGFGGEMRPESRAAAVAGIFRHVFIRNLFYDELGPEDSPAWQSFISMIQAIYGADQDHLLGRENSPFWDDVNTPEKETKADIIARSLADTILYATEKMGQDRGQWQWGRIHQYRWRTTASKMRPFMPFWKRWAVGIIAGYTDRGPYPAGGDYNTINAAGYHKGKDFDVWLVPAMRMVVDFSKEEPMTIINSSGQSGNPASPHYDDGISVWRNGLTRPMPFGDKRIAAQYRHVYVLRASD